MLRKVFLNLTKAGVTFAILWFLYQRGMLDFTRVKVVVTNIPVMLTSFTLLCTTAVIAVFRWKMLLLGQKMHLSTYEALRLTMIGVFFNTALPGAVSGDVVKGYYVVRQQPDKKGKIKSFATLLLDRLLGLSALIFISFFVMMLNYSDMTQSPTLKSLASMITLMFMAVVSFYLFVLIPWSFSEKIKMFCSKLPAGELFVKFYDSLKAYENCRHYIIKGLLLSIVIHTTIISVFILLAKSLGGFENVAFSKFFFLAPMGLLVTAVPVAPAGLGTGHAAFAWLFHQVGSSAGADLFTAYVSLQIMISLIGGIFYLRYRSDMPTAEETAN